MNISELWTKKGPGNIQLGCKGLTGTNTIAYYSKNYRQTIKQFFDSGQSKNILRKPQPPL
jgi:hypothetical protein